MRICAADLARTTFAAVEELSPGTRSVFADQMRRAAASVYANLAEGEGRPAGPDRLRFFTMAWASLRELEAHLDLAHTTGSLPAAHAIAVRTGIRHTGRMLHALRRSLLTGA